MTTVAVLFGGPSLEHEVSRETGGQIVEALDRTRFSVIAVCLARDGRWLVDGREYRDALAGAAALRDAGCDVCFLALHGPFGEDGTIQGFFETIGMRFTGSGMAGSARARDKVRAKRLLSAHGIPGAQDLVVPPAARDDVASALGFPVVVKDPIQGSSLGLRLARDETELAAAFAALAPAAEHLLVERRVTGRELTAPVLEGEDGRPVALPLVEIRAPDAWFDYHAKYTEGVTEEITPAPVAAALTRRLQDVALRAHRIFGLRGLSRTDFIVRPDDSFVVLETNTMPGFTANSLFPKAAAAAGISFGDLCAHLVERALAS